MSAQLMSKGQSNEPSNEPLEEQITARDHAVIAGELGREPRNVTSVAARCPHGYPAVIETAPLLGEGAPNPTLFYLTCPTLVAAISREEASGGVRRFRQAAGSEEELRAVLAAITRLYRQRRAALAGRQTTVPRCSLRLEAGIGGPEDPKLASCLHAYGAALLAVLAGWLLDEGKAREQAGVPSSAPLRITDIRQDDEGGGAAGGKSPEERLVAAAREVWLRFLPALEDSWCNDRRCSRWDVGHRPAAIDVGTISVRLLVADIVEGKPRTIVRRAEVTHLGEGLRPGGRFGEAAKQRTAAAVARYANEARALAADSIILAATNAARIAADGREFIAQLGQENQLTAVVLSGPREAELSFAGASLDVPGDPVVLDIGGGSTELTRKLEDGTLRTVSLEIGASRATQLWLKSDPHTATELAEAKGEAAAVFSRLDGGFNNPGPDFVSDPVVGQRSLVGVAGTITTLAALDSGFRVYDSEHLHLRPLTLEAVRALAARLAAMTEAERAALPCVQPGRAAVLVGGAVILEAAMEALGYDRLIVSERDLLDGLIMHGA